MSAHEVVEAIWPCGIDREDDELDFAKGDVIELLSRSYRGDVEWWFGTLNGSFGKFPSNYVKELSPRADDAAGPTSSRCGYAWLSASASALFLALEGVAAIFVPRTVATVPQMFQPQAHCFHKVTNMECFASHEGTNLYIVLLRLFGAALVCCAVLAATHGSRDGAHLVLGLAHAALAWLYRDGAIGGVERERGFNSKGLSPESVRIVDAWRNLLLGHLVFVAVGALAMLVAVYGALRRELAAYQEKERAAAKAKRA